MLGMWVNYAYLSTVNFIKRVIKKENGDTNFISILIILGVVIIVAAVFIGFKNQIVTKIQSIVSSFTSDSSLQYQSPGGQISGGAGGGAGGGGGGGL